MIFNIAFYRPRHHRLLQSHRFSHNAQLIIIHIIFFTSSISRVFHFSPSRRNASPRVNRRLRPSLNWRHNRFWPSSF